MEKIKWRTKRPRTGRRTEGGLKNGLANPCERKNITKTKKIHAGRGQETKWEIPVQFKNKSPITIKQAMNGDIHRFMLQWGPIITAIICLIAGFIHARIACSGTPQQKVVTYIVVLIVMLACVLSIQLDHAPGEKLQRGQIAQMILLGVPIPLLAGIGLFAWVNPEKLAAIAENRKYMRKLKGKE